MSYDQRQRESGQQLAKYVHDYVAGRCRTAICIQLCILAAGGNLNKVRFGEQHSSNIALAILAGQTALYEGVPVSSCQVRQ